ncbi:hypothetical protein EDEG_01801 [Edhazardia aedis USNM 41457]|uniref:Uncharacterized protein n=1 Tax=Edhazardia aedis (strain USNM 41457) TaxID=1003232 RepID=J9DRE2_EDHAE|nr:hypothetical protein EDEG_01801 [Edhazardia aedis USNM 41457]|eukprot:EJW03907.1 hypothetical protein EDEG_01801 [Edhazardia aedis USNM 41457]
MVAKKEKWSLTYISNANIFDTNISEEIKNNITVDDHNQQNYDLALVAYYKINPLDSSLKISQRDERLLPLRIQIIMDKISQGDPGTSNLIDENDLLYLQSIFKKTKNNFLAVKILQFLKFIAKKIKYTNIKTLQEKNMKYSTSFCIEVEGYINNIVSRETIAMSIGCTEFLLSCEYRSQRAYDYIFLLLSNKNPTVNIVGLRLVKENSIFQELAFKKILKRKFFTKNLIEHLSNHFITTENIHLCIEHINKFKNDLYLEGHKEKDVENVIMSLMKKIDNPYCSPLDKNIVKKNPSLAFYTNISRILGKNCCLTLFDEISNTESIYSYPLFYQILENVELNADQIYQYFEKHISKIIDCYITAEIKGLNNILNSIFGAFLRYGDIYKNYEFYNKKCDLLRHNSETKGLYKTFKTFDVCFKAFLRMKYVKFGGFNGFSLWYYVQFDTNGFKKTIYISVYNTIDDIFILETDEYCVSEVKVEDLKRIFVVECVDFESQEINLKINCNQKEFCRIISTDNTYLR